MRARTSIQQGFLKSVLMEGLRMRSFGKQVAIGLIAGAWDKLIEVSSKKVVRAGVVGIVSLFTPRATREVLPEGL